MEVLMWSSIMPEASDSATVLLSHTRTVKRERARYSSEASDSVFDLGTVLASDLAEFTVLSCFWLR